MFGTIRKHQQWLWVLIVTATIVSLVILFNPAQRYGVNASRGATFGSIGGRPITQEMVNESRRQSEVAHVLRTGSAQNYRPEAQTFQHLLLKEKFHELGIHVSDAQVASWIKENLTDPQTKRLIYDEWMAEKKTQGFSEADIQTFIRHEISTRHLAEVAGVGSQLITPREAEAEYRRENEQVAVSIVDISSSNYLAGVRVDPAALAQFYTNRQASYRIPERLQIAYLTINFSNYFPAVDAEMAKDMNLTNLMEQTYTQRGADSFRDAADKVMTKEAAMEEIRKNARISRAYQQALPAFKQIANELFAMDPITIENLSTVAAKNNLRVEVSQPFTAGSLIDGFEKAPSLSQEVASLSLQEPFITKPVPTETGIHLIALQNRIPSEIQPLDMIRARVTEDFRREQALSAAREAGRAMRISITNALGKGRSFAAAAADQKITARDLPPFNLTAESLPGVDISPSELDSIKNRAFALKAGEISEFSPTRTGGFIAYLKERKPVEEATVKAELPKYMKDLRDRTKMAAFQDWFSQEFEKSGFKKYLPQTGQPNMMEQ